MLIKNYLKNRRNQMAQGGPGVPGGPGGAVSPQLEGRLSSLESKVDRLITHLGVK